MLEHVLVFYLSFVIPSLVYVLVLEFTPVVNPGAKNGR